ncbi:sigma-70 family RNA polymerase sigma factor [Oscillatoria acuminata]|uniref:DNA-directed RNA polymerase specialized sigma subunit n=1 Tax=Oscillatoria acuminata PCC 6304 TaxID=56110 RepID=K9TE60_9CYAN|nr:DNA-directed RNA polymerase specialized sigma subunit [Oscillatoria acuminata]AFY80431.1 DNA-directed RNA polymerase specialized sigma subunit [Oscillatoria acuminata PCC 6304]
MLSPSNPNLIPTPPRRSPTVNQFATYLRSNHEGGRWVLEWKTEPRLRRNIQLYIAQDPNFADLCDRSEDGRAVEQFWIALALDPLPPQGWEPPDRQQLAFQHLASYYEPICHQAARSIADKHSQILWEDALTIARIWLQKQDKLAEILSKYQPNGPAKFSTYLQEVLMRNIKSETDVGRYSSWRLLCKIADYKLAEALTFFNPGSPQVSQILLARKYFKQVYTANRINVASRRLGEIWPAPQPEDFTETAKFYNAHRCLPSAPVEVAANPPSNAAQIESWMQSCLDALKYKIPEEHEPLSLEKWPEQQGLEIADPKTESEDWILEQLSEGDCPDSPLSQLNRIHELFEIELRGCRTILEVQLGDRRVLIDKDRILPLKYGIGLTQHQIGELCGINQSSVNRKLKTYKTRLLSVLTQLSQPEERAIDSVQGWLQKHFLSPNQTDLIAQALVKAIKTLKSEDRELLSLRYGQKLTVQQIGDRLEITTDQVQSRLNNIETQLHKCLFTTLGNWIKKYVDKWLDDFYKTALSHLFNQGFNSLSPEIQKILKLSYTHCVPLDQIAARVGLDQERVHHLVWEGICLLESHFVQKISEILEVSLVGNLERQRIAQLTKEWLNNLHKFD